MMRQAVQIAPPPEFLAAFRIPWHLRVTVRLTIVVLGPQAAVSVGVRSLLDPHHDEGDMLFLNDAEVTRVVFAELRLRGK